jgi:transposase
MRASPAASPESAPMLAPRILARRSQALSGELTALDAELDRLTRAAAPKLVAQFGVGTNTAGALLVAAGDNPRPKCSAPS